MGIEGVRVFYKPGLGHWVGIPHLCGTIYIILQRSTILNLHRHQCKLGTVQYDTGTASYRCDRVMNRKAADTVSNSVVFML